jgi:NitT/TauT family transport system permease protein/taurine transport system permease protein
VGNQTVDLIDLVSLDPGGPTLRPAPRWRKRSAYLVAFALAVGVWWLLTAVHAFPSFALPSPGDVYQAFVTLTTTGYLSATLQQDLVASLARVGVAFAGAVVAGTVIGVIMAESKVIFGLIDPFLQFLRPIPPLAFIPLFVVWFGIGESPKVLLILVSTVPVIIINTISGVRDTPRQRLEVARCLGATRSQTLRYVVLPSALPSVFTGMKVGVGVAWSTLVAAELIAAQSGLGWLVEQAGQELQTATVVVGIIVIGIVGYLMELAIRSLEAAVVPWRGKA